MDSLNQLIEKMTTDDPAVEGSRYFKEKNYWKALEYYTMAIESNPNDPVLLDNRAAIYLCLQNGSLALIDVDAGLALNSSNKKLLYRKVKALLMLKRYDEAVKFLDETHQRFGQAVTDNKVFMKLIEQSKIMHHESETGDYDMRKMKEESKRSKFLNNHADYIASSLFERKEIPGKTRGLVAKTDIPAGTLLMANKALAFVTSDEVKTASNALEFFPHYHTVIEKKICEKLMANPELRQDFYQLDDGPELGVRVDYDPRNPIDILRIWMIIRMNAYFIKSGERSMPFGLWMPQAYMNHSCVDNNCFVFTIGDFSFIRSKTLINRGEELLCSYVQFEEPYNQRSEKLRGRLYLGFICDCRLCLADRAQPPEILARYERINKCLQEMKIKFEKTQSFTRFDYLFLKKLLEEVTEYRPDKTINILAIRIRNLLSAAVSPSKALKLLEESFQADMVMIDVRGAFDVAKAAMCLAMKVGNRSLIEKWSFEVNKLGSILWGDPKTYEAVEEEN